MNKLGVIFWWLVAVACFLAAGKGFGFLLFVVFFVIGLLWLIFG